MSVPPTLNLVGAAAIGLFLGPVALRQTVKALPGTMGSKWQLHRALSWGEGWLIHQTGAHSYDLMQIPADQDTAEVNGEEVDLTQLGHISTKTGSVPVGVSYGPQAVEESPHVGITPDKHISPRDDGESETPDDTDDDGPTIDTIDRFEHGVHVNGDGADKNGEGAA
jgi:hypothetical protein